MESREFTHDDNNDLNHGFESKKAAKKEFDQIQDFSNSPSLKKDLRHIKVSHLRI